MDHLKADQRRVEEEMAKAKTAEEIKVALSKLTKHERSLLLFKM
jgi:hypothetical protein